MRQKLKSDPIDGFVYEVTQLGAMDGKRLYAQVLKIALPALGAAFKGQNLSEASQADVASMALDEVATTLAGSLDGLDPMIETLARTTDITGPGFGDAGAPLMKNFDDHFAGRYAAMTKWLMFALKVNLLDFFDGKASVANMLAGLVAKASPSPTI